MDEKIKNKVRDIQHRYCGEPVETKLYYAIKETIQKILNIVNDAPDKDYVGEHLIKMLGEDSQTL